MRSRCPSSPLPRAGTPAADVPVACWPWPPWTRGGIIIGPFAPAWALDADRARHCRRSRYRGGTGGRSGQGGQSATVHAGRRELRVDRARRDAGRFGRDHRYRRLREHRTGRAAAHARTRPAGRCARRGPMRRHEASPLRQRAFDDDRRRALDLGRAPDGTGEALAWLAGRVGLPDPTASGDPRSRRSRPPGRPRCSGGSGRRSHRSRSARHYDPSLATQGVAAP